MNQLRSQTSKIHTTMLCYIYNVCNRILFPSKSARRCDPEEKKYFVEVFWANIRMHPEELKKILTKHQRTAQ